MGFIEEYLHQQAELCKIGKEYDKTMKWFRTKDKQLLEGALEKKAWIIPALKYAAEIALWVAGSYLAEKGLAKLGVPIGSYRQEQALKNSYKLFYNQQRMAARNVLNKMFLRNALDVPYQYRNFFTYNKR